MAASLSRRKILYLPLALGTIMFVMVWLVLSSSGPAMAQNNALLTPAQKAVAAVEHEERVTAVAAPQSQPLLAAMTVTIGDSSWADDGQCSLREAIANANLDTQVFTSPGECAAGSGADTITLGLDVTLTITDNNADGNGNNGLPVITSTITISGAGHTLSRDNAAPPFRFFYLNNGSSILTLHNITITNGHADAAFGGVLRAIDRVATATSSTAHLSTTVPIMVEVFL